MRVGFVVLATAFVVGVLFAMGYLKGSLKKKND